MIKKLFAFSLAVLFAACSTGAGSIAAAAELSVRTPVVITSDKTVSEDSYKTGDIVNFRVVNSVKNSEGDTVLPPGALVKGKIKRLEPKKRIGRPAELMITDFTSTLPDGRQLAFNGGIYRKSESRMARSIVLSAVLLPFFLLMKGAAVELPAGSQTTIYPAVDYRL